MQNAVEDYHNEDYHVKYCKDYKSLVLQGLQKQTSPQESGSPTIKNISHPISYRPIVPNIDGRRREQSGTKEVKLRSTTDQKVSL